MDDHTLSCPSCGSPVPITEALQKQVETRLQADFAKQMSEKELVFKAEQAKLQKSLEEKEASLGKRLEEEKKKLWATAQEKAKEKLDLELKDLKEQNEEAKKKIDDFMKQELELRKKARELEEEKKRMDVEMERKLDKEREEIRKGAMKDADEEHRLKVREYEKKFEQMNKQIEDLKRKGEQGSMQIQGDVLENDLKTLLMQAFPVDVIEDVPTGIHGADLIHTVRNSLGRESGIMLWEAKNTKAWSQGWIKKLKDDQAQAKAGIAILVTKALPPEVTTFGEVDGIWVTSFDYIVPLAHVLRLQLIELSQAKSAMVGRDQKMELLYQYLSGSEFKNRVENIVHAFRSMKEELDKEKRAFTRMWSKREKEIERVILNTSGMYGDLQGIIGGGLPQIQELEVPMLDDGEEYSDE